MAVPWESNIIQKLTEQEEQDMLAKLVKNILLNGML
jgi:hypothetical protein